MIDKNVSILSFKGDITKLNVDAIVNAANSTLIGGGGVDGAIHKAAGKELLKECMGIIESKFPNGLPVGEAVVTNGYNLSAKYIIHTVGPVYKGGNNSEDNLLYSAYYNSCRIAVSKQVKTIAFPNISTGAYRYPIEEASFVRNKAISDFLKDYPNSLEEIVLVDF
jgi:O-acetyl-ADP-ribose deacetylase (regulator of RNase III)